MYFEIDGVLFKNAYPLFNDSFLILMHVFNVSQFSTPSGLKYKKRFIFRFIE